MRLLPAALFLAVASAASAQQKVDIRRASTPTVNVRLSGSFSSLHVVAWPQDSIALTGAVGAGYRLEGGPLNFAGPVTGMKFFLESTSEAIVAAGKEGTRDASVAANKLELRVPRNARVWVKTGSADIDVSGVAGGLDLNIIAGSVRVDGKPRELLVEAMDGSVTFRGFAEYARLKTATGNITLDGGGDDLSLTTVSGSIQAANGDRALQRARFESVTGSIIYTGDPARDGDFRFDTHSGPIELRLTRGASIEVDASTLTGAIENAWSKHHPIAGREGRGMELGVGVSSGTTSARVQVKTFKGNIRLTAK